MKKRICLLLALLLALLAFSACGGDDPSGESVLYPKKSIDLDLSKLSSTMLYAAITNMVSSPESYLGRVVRVTGDFLIYNDTTRDIYSCLVSDATVCCAQDVEFVLEGNPTYPDDYPEVGQTITVTGVFDTYVEDGYTYCHLIHAEISH